MLETVIRQDGRFGVHAFVLDHQFEPLGQNGAQFVSLDIDHSVDPCEVGLQKDLFGHIHNFLEVEAIERLGLQIEHSEKVGSGTDFEVLDGEHIHGPGIYKFPLVKDLPHGLGEAEGLLELGGEVGAEGELLGPTHHPQTELLQSVVLLDDC